jgi:hypothetical protein
MSDKEIVLSHVYIWRNLFGRAVLVQFYARRCTTKGYVYDGYFRGSGIKTYSMLSKELEPLF